MTEGGTETLTLGVIVGVDYGDRRIGIAVTDEFGSFAFPLTVIESRGIRRDAMAVAEIVRDRGAEEVVVGLPLNMDGTMGDRAVRTLEFCRTLAGLSPVPVRVHDERMTTQEAERVLISADLSRRRRRQVVDKTAAAIILQGYLDRVKSTGSRGREVEPDPASPPEE